MVKSKKPKKQVNLKPEYVLDPKAPQAHRQKKKHAPDRPQPEWMFPPDEENPVLNPKAKSRERLEKDKKDHDHAIKFLKYKAVSTPLKAPPPALLLTLVGSFLTSYGFNSTSRLYTTELLSRKRLDEWNVVLDKELPKGFPDLVKLFKVGQKTFDEQKRMEETSSSDEDDDEERKAYKKSRKLEKANKKAGQKAGKKVGQKTVAEVEETSSSGSDDSSEVVDSDEEMVEAPAVTRTATHLSTRSEHDSSSSPTSSSDSDADDEQELAGAQLPEPKPPQSGGGPTNALDRKAVPEVHEPAKTEVRGRGGTGAVQLSSEEENSSEESEIEEDATAAKSDIAGSQSIEPSTARIPDSDSGSTSSSSESESMPDSSSPTKPNTATITTTHTTTAKKPRDGSSSSETLQGATDHKTTTAETSLSSSPSSSGSNPPDDAHEEGPAANPSVSAPSRTTAMKRKREDKETAPVSQKQQKKINTPFERVPKDTPVDERFTNKYKSYDYADRAYQDLSVTKGKGFTKEKNKKKRGSYRGGAIDVGGGKGIKFED